MKEIIIQGVKIRYRWEVDGREVDRCPLCGKTLPEVDEKMVEDSIPSFRDMKNYARYIMARDKLIRDIKSRKITLKDLQDRYRRVTALSREISHIVAAKGQAVMVRCEECGQPLLFSADAWIENKPPGLITYYDILQLDEGAKTMKYFIKRELGMFWPEIRERIEKGEKHLIREVAAFLNKYAIFGTIMM